MGYQSPLHIIKSISVEEQFEITDTNLIRLRKRLLAELNLSGDATITVNGKAYSKDEIIKTIDLLLDNPDLALHEFIYKNTFLLKFLEDETLTLNPFLYRDLHIEHEIKHKLNLLVYERFITQFKKGFSTRTFTQSEQAIVLFESLPEDLREICYEEVHRSLFTLHTFLHELENHITLDKKEDIRFLSYESFSSFLNSLSDDFEDVKFDIVNRVINILVAYHKLKKHDKDLTRSISTVLVRIKCNDPEQEKLIKNNHKVFTVNESTTDYSSIRYIGIAIIIIINVLRGCNRNDSPKVDRMIFTNGNSLVTQIMEENKLHYLSEELNSFKTEIHNKKMVTPGNGIGISYDTIKINTGTNPFLGGFKQYNDSVVQCMRETILLENKTKYDLIVMCYDSAQTSIYSKYVKQNESSVFCFNQKARFMFYFGNKLLRPITFNNQLPNYLNTHEYFAETPAIVSDLLAANYRVSLTKKKYKKTPVLTIDSVFLVTVKDELKMKGVNLLRSYE